MESSCRGFASYFENYQPTLTCLHYLEYLVRFIAVLADHETTVMRAVPRLTPSLQRHSIYRQLSKNGIIFAAKGPIFNARGITTSLYTAWKQCCGYARRIKALNLKFWQRDAKKPKHRPVAVAPLDESTWGDAPELIPPTVPDQMPKDYRTLCDERDRVARCIKNKRLWVAWQEGEDDASLRKFLLEDAPLMMAVSQMTFPKFAGKYVYQGVSSKRVLRKIKGNSRGDKHDQLNGLNGEPTNKDDVVMGYFNLPPDDEGEVADARAIPVAAGLEVNARVRMCSLAIAWGYTFHFATTVHTWHDGNTYAMCHLCLSRDGFHNFHLGVGAFPLAAECLAAAEAIDLMTPPGQVSEPVTPMLSEDAVGQSPRFGQLGSSHGEPTEEDDMVPTIAREVSDYTSDDEAEWDFPNLTHYQNVRARAHLNHRNAWGVKVSWPSYERTNGIIRQGCLTNREFVRQSSAVEATLWVVWMWIIVSILTLPQPLCAAATLGSIILWCITSAPFVVWAQRHHYCAALIVMRDHLFAMLLVATICWMSGVQPKLTQLLSSHGEITEGDDMPPKQAVPPRQLRRSGNAGNGNLLLAQNLHAAMGAQPALQPAAPPQPPRNPQTVPYHGLWDNNKNPVAINTGQFAHLLVQCQGTKILLADCQPSMLVAMHDIGIVEGFNGVVRPYAGIAGLANPLPQNIAVRHREEVCGQFRVDRVLLRTGVLQAAQEDQRFSALQTTKLVAQAEVVRCELSTHVIETYLSGGSISSASQVKTVQFFDLDAQSMRIAVMCPSADPNVWASRYVFQSQASNLPRTMIVPTFEQLSTVFHAIKASEGASVDLVYTAVVNRGASIRPRNQPYWAFLVFAVIIMCAQYSPLASLASLVGLVYVLWPQPSMVIAATHLNGCPNA